MSAHPAAVVFDELVSEVDQWRAHATRASRVEFWSVFAARTMGMLAAQLGREAFDEFIAMTLEQADELFAEQRKGAMQ